MNQITIMTTTSLTKKISYFIALAAFAAKGSAAPLVSLGDDIELYLLGTAGLEYESNLFASSVTEVDDFRLTLSPGVEFAFGGSSAATAKLIYRHHFHFYEDNTALDGDYADLSFQGRYDTAVFIGSLSASFRERSSNSAQFLGGETISGSESLISRDEYRVAANGRYQVSQLTAFSVGAEYEEMNFRSANQTSYDSITVPVTYFYRVRPNMDLTVGYRYRKTDVDGLFPGSRDNFFTIGAQGELGSPLFAGNATVGYQERKLRGVDYKTDSMFYNFMVTYLASARVSHFVSLSRDFRTSSTQGQTFTYAALTVGTRARVSNMVTANASLTYAKADYRDAGNREEDQVFFNVGMTYSPNDYLNINANYGYSNIDGSGALANEYTRNRISVSASVRY